MAEAVEKEKTSGGIESNWTSLALACSQAVRPRIFVPHTYVSVAFGDPAVGGCNGSDGLAGGKGGRCRIKHRRRHRQGTWCMRGVLSPRGESHARLLGSLTGAEEMGATVPWRGWVCMCAYIHTLPRG